MVELNSNAQTILLKLIDQYCDFHKQGEYGTSSFWNWYYQVRNYIYQLDRQSRPIGIGLNYTMQTWGDIYFSRVIVGGEVFVVVTDFEFNTTNFFNWICYNRLPSVTPQPSPTQTIISWDFDDNYEPYNEIYVVVSNNGLYSLTDKNKRLLINKWFDRITFPLNGAIDGIETIGQGTASNIKYLITPNLRVIHPAEIAVRNRRKIENKQYMYRIISESINKFLRGIVNEDRDVRIRRIVRESIDRYINKIVA